MTALYVDVQAFLSGDLVGPETGAGGRRSDGLPLLYRSATNVLLGDPESGKTLIATACACDEIWSRGSILWIDLDHNGAHATLNRFRSFGIETDTLVNEQRFRLAIPDDSDDVLALVADATIWQPTLVVIDSMGELLPMFGANSNDSDDFTRVNRQVMASFAQTGAAVLVIDHLAKNSQSREYGGTGTAAKKRAVDGGFLRVSLIRAFAPSKGGIASLSIVKDRHGFLRANAGSGREPVVSVFEMSAGAATTWVFHVPEERAGSGDADVEKLLALTTPPSSVRDVKNRMKWGTDKASKAWKAFQERSGNVPACTPGTEGDVCSPVPSPYRGNGEHALGNTGLELVS